MVNGDAITFGQLDSILEREYGQQVVSELITEKLVDQEARKHHITVSKAEVDQAVRQTLPSVPPARLDEAARQNFGVSLEGLREQQRVLLELQKLLGPRVKVTEDELRQYYQQNQQQFSTPQEVRLERVVTDDKAKAEAASQDLSRGAGIQDVVHKYGVRSGSAAKLNGTTDFIPIDQLPLQILPTVAQMAKGDVSPPLKTDDGYVVVRVVDRRGGEVRPFDQVRDQVREAVKQKKIQEMAGPYVESLWRRAKIVNQFGPMPTAPPEPAGQPAPTEVAPTVEQPKG